MQSNIDDILETAVSNKLTYQQKLYSLANIAERLVDQTKVLNYTQEEIDYIENDIICDLNEGGIPYRPRYIIPDYNVLVQKGSNFLGLDPPKNLDELLDSLIILYHNVPSITSFPVFVGFLDKLFEPFLSGDDEADYIKIKRFLNHIDKTVPDSFCHANIGPEKTRSGELILRAVVELQNPTPNMTLHYDKDITPDDFALKAVEACLYSSKPSFSNVNLYNKDVGTHAVASCYNPLPLGGGSYTLIRLRLGTLVGKAKSVDHFMDELLKNASEIMLSIMDKRVRFIHEKSNFFESTFLLKEGFISSENFTAMFGIVGLAECVNKLLEFEKINERYGNSSRGDELAHMVLGKLREHIDSHESPHCSRTGNHYLLHGQVGASITDEDSRNTPAHRIPVGEEPNLPEHLKQAVPMHRYFNSGTGDLFAFDQTYTDHTDALLDIIKGTFKEGGRYITTYLQNSDLIRVTGYLVKKSEVEKYEKGEAVLRDTAMLASGTNADACVFNRKTRK